MNRSSYFNYIEEHLITLSTRIDKTGKLNNLHLHHHSENFYKHFLKELFGWNLENANEQKQNVEAIDLVDDSSKLVVQVSAKNTKDKIESCLKKNKMKDFSGYTFKYVSISKDADKLRKGKFINPHGVLFDPSKDIFDILSILSYIDNLDIKSQKRIYEFIKLELGRDVDIVKLDSNLATIINILSKEDWDSDGDPTVDSFEIERKISYNNLNSAKHIIDDYSAHSAQVDKKYTEFDTQGVNKSGSVLAKIKKEYLKNLKAKSEDDIFFSTINGVIKQVVNSANYVKIPVDELELSVNILVVDAFIRCKIFENPKNYNHANS